MAPGHSFAPGPAAGRNTVPGSNIRPLNSFGHWLWRGNAPGAGLSAVPGQLLNAFNPTTRAGWANIAGIFAGGPKDGGLEGEMAMRQVPGHFTPYSNETGTALDRGLTNEGPIRPGRGYNPSIQKMVERAHTNPFMRASKGAVDDAYNRLSAIDKAKVRAAHAQAMRRQIDDKLGFAPMAGRPSKGAPEHDASLLHPPSVVNHPSFIRGLLSRRYEAGAQHHN